MTPIVGLNEEELNLLCHTYTPGFTWAQFRKHPAMANVEVPEVGPASRTDFPCQILHLGSSCTDVGAKFKLSLSRGLMVYIPFYCIQLAAFRRTKLMAAPTIELQRTLVSIARSTSFLTLASVGAWVVHCFFHSTLRFHHWIVPFIAGASGGLPILFEPAGRRPEVALYVVLSPTPLRPTIHTRQPW